LTESLQILALSLLAGITIPMGAYAAHAARNRRPWDAPALHHGIVAFGGGVLLSAVALVLVPEGIKALSVAQVVLAFGAGGLCFLLLDRLIARRAGAMGQLLAMVIDFIPEALAMGAALASGEPVGLLLALLIATQNLPEGFNAFEEVTRQTSVPTRRVFLAFWALVLIGPASAFAGVVFLADRPVVLGSIMVFAAAGIIYLTFEDIAPAVPLERSWAPPLGAVLGFLLGLVGHMALG